MHKTVLRQGNQFLITGILVLLVAVGLSLFLWLFFEAPFLWIAFLAWLVVPLVPFAITLLNSSQQRATE